MFISHQFVRFRFSPLEITLLPPIALAIVGLCIKGNFPIPLSSMGMGIGMRFFHFGFANYIFIFNYFLLGEVPFFFF